MIFQDCTQLISSAKYLIASFPVLLMHSIDQVMLRKYFLMCSLLIIFRLSSLVWWCPAAEGRSL